MISVFLVALLLAPASAFAQASPQEIFEGTWAAPEPKEEAMKGIKEKVNETVSELNFVLRPFARRKLTEATKLCDDLTFDFQGPNLSITCDDRPVQTAPVNQGQGLYTNEEGNRYVLVHKVGAGQILQVFADENGTRENRYTVSPDGMSIEMEVTIDSKQLPEPLVFTREFKKAG